MTDSAASSVVDPSSHILIIVNPITGVCTPASSADPVSSPAMTTKQITKPEIEPRPDERQDHLYKGAPLPRAEISDASIMSLPTCAIAEFDEITACGRYITMYAPIRIADVPTPARLNGGPLAELWTPPSFSRNQRQRPPLQAKRADVREQLPRGCFYPVVVAIATKFAKPILGHDFLDLSQPSQSPLPVEAARLPPPPRSFPTL